MTPEENRRLSSVGAGTPVGTLLRRYWHPVAASAELEDTPVKPIRLLGEDLVLYRDRRGTYGLLGRHCPHRRADLSYGWVEDAGLRCSYHGWLFDEAGGCREQPFEDTADPGSRFRASIRQPAYQVEARAGMLWAYLGPSPAPVVPNWEPFTWTNGFVQVVTSEVPCNWLQAQDNSIDPVHFEWLHENWRERMAGEDANRAPRHQKIAFDEFDDGFTYKRVREGADETGELWRVGRVCLWPNAVFTGNHFEWRVPVDDETTLSIGWFFEPVPTDRRPYRQERVPYWTSPVRDEATGRWVTSHIMNQDFVAWVGQGVLSDREEEHLGRSDRGVALMRRWLSEQADVVARGEDPKGLRRDPLANDCVPLPIVGRQRLREGPTRSEFLEELAQVTKAYGGPFRYLAGQPQEVADEYDGVMGLKA
jgi:5,5'-dehydrodivanillate O-demethylase oxygenase subunit